MTNKYLEKIALTRLVKEIAKGAVKAPVESLVQKGALRSMETYTSGINKGTEALAKRFNATIREPANGAELGQVIQFGNAATYAHPNGKIDIVHSKPNSFIRKFVSPIHSVKGGERINEFNHAIALRHEVYEAQAAREAQKAGEPLEVNRFVDSSGVLRGAHLSPTVLAREGNLLRATPHAGAGKMKGNRVDSGEAAILNRITGKVSGRDKFMGKDMKKLRKASPDLKYIHGEAFSSMDPEAAAKYNENPAAFHIRQGVKGLAMVAAPVAGASLLHHAMENRKKPEEKT